MLRLVSKRLVPALVLGLGLTLPLVGFADPVLRVTFAPPHELDTFVGDLTKLGGKPEKAGMVRELFIKTGMYDGAGIDTMKRLGIVVNVKDGAPPAPTLIVPVKDETKFLAAFKPFYPQQEKLPDGRWKLLTEKAPPLAIRIDKGWAYVNMLSEAEVPPPGDPEKLTAGQGTMDISISVASFPESTKKQVLDGVKQGAAQKEAALPTEAEKAQARAGAQAFVQALEKFFATTDSISLALTLNLQEFRMDFEMHTKPGAAPVPTSGTAPLGMAALVPATAAVGFASDMSLDDMARQAMKESAKTGFTAARQQGGPPPKMKFLDAMEVEIENLVKSGRVEGIAMVEGKKGAAHVVMMIRTAAESKIGEAMKLVVDEIAKNPNASQKPTSKTEGNLTVYTMESPSASMTTDLGGREIALGVRPGVVTMVVGGKTTEKIKALLAQLDGVKPPPPGIGSTKGWFGIRSFADIAGVDTFAKTKTEADTFTKLVIAGSDQIGFQLEPQKDGYKSALYLQSGLVAMIARFLVKDPPSSAPMPAGDPGMGLPPAGGTAPAPEASTAPAPEASAAPAPEASAAPEAPASPSEGEGEKEEGETKKKGGDEE